MYIVFVVFCLTVTISFLLEFPHDFKFVILVSAFKSLTYDHVTLFERLEDHKIIIPSLHIIGENDQIVDPNLSEKFATEYFAVPMIVRHSGGHTIPSQAIFREAYHQFLDSMEKFDRLSRD